MRNNDLCEQIVAWLSEETGLPAIEILERIKTASRSVHRQARADRAARCQAVARRASTPDHRRKRGHDRRRGAVRPAADLPGDGAVFSSTAQRAQIREGVRGIEAAQIETSNARESNCRRHGPRLLASNPAMRVHIMNFVLISMNPDSRMGISIRSVGKGDTLS
jgi:hypothetical protein